MTPDIILWIYIVLLVAGGLMGFIKARSKMSLVTSVAFAVALSLCAMRIVPNPVVADALLVVLLIFFGMRFSKTRKFMPMGLMTILSVLALALRQLVS